MVNEQSSAPYKAGILIPVSAFLSVVFDYLLIDRLPGIGFFVFISIGCLALFLLGQIFNKKIARDVVPLVALAIFFSSLVAVHANLLLSVLTISSTLLILVLALEVQVKGSIKQFILSDYIKLLVRPITYLNSSLQVCKSVRLPFTHRVDPRTRQIIRGIIFTIPVALLFIALFAGADPVFNTVFKSISTFNFALPQHPLPLIISCIIFCGAFSYFFSTPSELEITTKETERVGNIEVTILLGSVNVLFGLFIVLQASYFFGGAANITNNALTYAEYARRGFFELTAIASLTLGLILFPIPRRSASVLQCARLNG